MGIESCIVESSYFSFSFTFYIELAKLASPFLELEITVYGMRKGGGKEWMAASPCSPL